MAENSDDPLALSVVAYRLTSLETDLKNINGKLDRFIDTYPSKELLELILKPYKDSINELEEHVKQQEAQRRDQKQQIRYILVAAVIAPIASIVMSALVAVLVAGMDGV